MFNVNQTFFYYGFIVRFFLGFYHKYYLTANSECLKNILTRKWMIFKSSKLTQNSGTDGYMILNY